MCSRRVALGAINMMFVKMRACLVVWDGEAKRREFSLLAVAYTLALPLAVHTHVLILALVIPGRLLVLPTPSAPASRAEVLCGLLIVLEHWALLVPLHTGTVHLVFTGNVNERREENNKNSRMLSLKLKWSCFATCFGVLRLLLITHQLP